MVRRLRYIFVIMILLLMGSNKEVYARYGLQGKHYYSSSQGDHFWGFSMSGGYAANPSSVEGISINKGWETSINFAYQFKKNSFLLYTGLGFQWQVASEKFDSTLNWHEPMVDTQNGEYTLNYSLNRNDYQRMGQLEIPLMFGQQLGSFYYLVGPKAYINLLGDTKQKLRVTTTATYDQYFSPLWGMANHGLRTDVHQDFTGKKFDYMADVRLALELGWNLYSGGGSGNTSTLIRLGAFAEGGILLPPVKSTAELPMEVTAPFNYSEWATCNVLNSSQANNHIIGSFSAGLRLTVLFTAGDVGSSLDGPAGRKYKCMHCEEDKIPRRRKSKCINCGY